MLVVLFLKKKKSRLFMSMHAYECVYACVLFCLFAFYLIVRSWNLAACLCYRNPEQQQQQQHNHHHPLHKNKKQLSSLKVFTFFNCFSHFFLVFFSSILQLCFALGVFLCLFACNST